MFKKLTANLNLKYDASQTVQGQPKQTYSPNKPRSHSFCMMILWFGPSLPSKRHCPIPMPDALARPACFRSWVQAGCSTVSVHTGSQEWPGFAFLSWEGQEGKKPRLPFGAHGCPPGILLAPHCLGNFVPRIKHWNPAKRCKYM